ncbi:MFS general substrate transporter [Martensiomyces pterosporus]|nr:MFS general substrate transporter [Martensiomyces pterosporus]
MPLPPLLLLLLLSGSVPPRFSAGKGCPTLKASESVEIHKIETARLNTAAGETKPAEPLQLSQLENGLVLFALSVATFMGSLDITAVATVMPVIGAQFDDLSSINWIATTYLLGMTCTIPAVGRMSDIWGRRNVFILFILVFIIGSVICGAAKSMKPLLAGRSLAGIGAGGQMMLPMVIVSDMGTERQRALNLGILAAVWAISSVVGPVIGGTLGEHSSWRWLFYMNAPIMGVTIPILYFFMRFPIPPGSAWEKLKRIDYLGILVVAGAALTLLLALNYGGNLYSWSSGVVILLFVLSGVFFAVFVFIETKVAIDPIMPLQLFKSRNAVALIFIQPFIGGATYVPTFYLMLWYSVVKGASPESSGLHLIPSVLTAALISMVSGAVITKTGEYRSHIILSTIILTIGGGMLVLYDETISNSKQIGFLIIVGIGIGLAMQSHIVGMQATCQGDDMAMATTTVFFFRMLGAAVIIAILNTIMQTSLTTKLTKVVLEHPLYAKYILDSVNNQDIIRLPVVPQVVREAVINANVKSLKSAFVANLALTAVTVPVALFVKHIPLSTDMNMVMI